MSWDLGGFLNHEFMMVKNTMTSDGVGATDDHYSCYSLCLSGQCTFMDAKLDLLWSISRHDTIKVLNLSSQFGLVLACQYVSAMRRVCSWGLQPLQPVSKTNVYGADSHSGTKSSQLTV